MKQRNNATLAIGAFRQRLFGKHAIYNIITAAITATAWGATFWVMGNTHPWNEAVVFGLGILLGCGWYDR